MEQNYLPCAAKLLAAQRKRKRWQQVVGCLGAAVVFCTVYALILPAITMSRPLLCQLEEHQHDESCYTAVEPAAEASPLAGVTAVLPGPEIRQLCSLESVYAGLAAGERASFVLHAHDAACYREGELICGFPEVLPHVHEDACYVQERILICGQEEEIEIPDELVPAGHIHTDECYGDVLVCGQEEVPASEGHRHSENCYTVETVQGGLICGNAEEEHEHDESCYAPEEIPVLTCGQEESEPAEGHAHTSDCFQRQLVCGVEEEIEEEEEPGEEPGTEDSGEPAPGHVHTEACYAPGGYVAGCGDRRIAHEHTAECRDESGALICGSLVTREHVHTPECFQEIAPSEPDSEPDAQPDPEKTLTCGKAEHTHEEACYGSEETEDPEDAENPEEPGEQDSQWDAVFWSGVVSEASDVVLDAWTNGSWMDTAAMDPEELARLREAGEVDLTRALQSAAIQVGSRAYDNALHGPMDPSGAFSIVLNWSLDSASFSSMTYSYEFPWQINVENVEKRVLNDAGGQQALAYSVWNNVLTVTYYAPAANVSTGFSLRASWAGDLGMDTEIQWSRSESTYVVFAEPELTVEKTMGEEGLRVAEDGSVWADYTVTVTNTGMVAAEGITLTGVLEAQRFAFARGGCENGADYMVTAGGRDSYESFAGYDGGDTVTFPAFDLEPEESRVFQYKAVMSAEDRAAVDAAIKASADPAQAAETVRSTATAVCPAPGGDLEFTSSARATYGGPESKHVENFTYNYQSESGAFDVVFTVNGDAQLPPGMTAEKLEQTTGAGLQLTVEALDETAGEYQAFARYVEEDENLLDLQVLRLGLNYNGVKLDLTGCDVEAVVTPSEALRNYKKPHVVTYNLSEEEKAAVEAEEEAGFDLELEVMDLTVQTAEVQTPEVQSLGTLTVEVNDGTESSEGIEQLEMQTCITAQLRSNYVAVREGINPYPSYTVQFYANLDRPAKTGDENNKVSIIDTSNKRLPQNGRGKLNSPNDNELISLYFQDGGGVQTTTELTRIFTERSRVYNPKVSLNLEMLDNISYEVTESGSSQIEDPHYALTELWVLKDIVNGDPASMNRDDWNVYTREQLQTIKFTNDPEKANDPNYIVVMSYEKETSNGTTKLIQTVFRMVYTPNIGSHTNEVNFYDYDISTTDRAAFNAYNGGQGAGINSTGNYSGTGTKFAFGNATTTVGVPFGSLRWNGYELNKFNQESYHGNTFGLVGTQYGADGKIQYSANTPNLFNEGSAEGKTSYDRGEYTLHFIREGDTYTLSAVNGSGVSGLENLQRGASQWTLKKTIWTNHFWPMDTAPTAGASGHDIVFGAPHGKNNAGEDTTNLKTVIAGGEGMLPVSDNKQDHNNYFGMQASFDFTIPATYVGPMEYYFFGDDDLWVFLDGQLVCDLGGVKSSTAGEYVNLGEYISKEADGSYVAGSHRLDLYYTERGASGSTCWMQFTIPNIRSVPLDQTPDGEKGSLRISKEVNGAVNKNQEYSFRLEIQNVTDIFSVKKYDKDLTETVINATEGHPGQYEFTLKAGESLAVFDLPKGKHFTITEIEDALNACETTITSSDRNNVVEGKVISGTSSADTTIYITYTNKFFYALPETGGAGTSGMVWYTLGALPVMAAAVLAYKRSRKKGGTQF